MNRREKSPPWFELAAARTKAQFTGASEHAATTERRIIEAVTRRKRKPSALWLVPLAVIGSGSLAWAEEVQLAVAWTVDQVQELVGAVSPPREPEAVTPSLPPARPKADVSARAPLAMTTVAPEATTVAAVGEETDAPTIQPTTESQATPPPPAAPASGAAPIRFSTGMRRDADRVSSASSVTAEPTDLERYRTGFTAQYERHDYAAALAAWDDYLKHVPGGRFTPEVRYHRALSLVQLGRREQAIAALEPFAAGAYGPLHQNSAKQMIEQLNTALDIATTGR